MRIKKKEAPPHTVSDFIGIQQKSAAFPTPIFTKIKNAQQHCV
jgi:hypothetical protein